MPFVNTIDEAHDHALSRLAKVVPAGRAIALIDWLKGTSGAARGRAALLGAGGRRVFVARRTCRTFESKSVGGSGSAASDVARPNLWRGPSSRSRRRAA